MNTADLANLAGTKPHYRSISVAGLDIFFREAGPRDAPTVLLLHGFPTSSHMFRDLITRLADRYHLVAPDYPGFGYSSMPDRADFSYTFENLANVVEEFTDKLGLNKYALYVMDYGAPIGYRLFFHRPERVSALIVQNGNAYEEGLRQFWDPLRRLWADPSETNREALREFTRQAATKWQYVHGVPDESFVSPDTWMFDQLHLDRPGNPEIQLDLFYDYRTNLPLYESFQACFRTHQPPALIVWGKNDTIFAAEGAVPYQRDLPKAEIHLLDAGHFALETHGPEIAALIRDFIDRRVLTR